MFDSSNYSLTGECDDNIYHPHRSQFPSYTQAKLLQIYFPDLCPHNDPSHDHDMIASDLWSYYGGCIQVGHGQMNDQVCWSDGKEVLLSRSVITEGLNEDEKVPEVDTWSHDHDFDIRSDVKPRSNAPEIMQEIGCKTESSNDRPKRPWWRVKSIQSMFLSDKQIEKMIKHLLCDVL